MKVSAIVLLAIQGLSALAQDTTAQDTCGSLGEFKPDLAKLPANIDQNNIRKCLEHPRSIEDENVGRTLSVRACLPKDRGSTHGCTGGYCWQRCGFGRKGNPWCWLAKNDGYGAWRTCSNKEQCIGENVKNDGCGKGNKDCKACGCGC